MSLEDQEKKFAYEYIRNECVASKAALLAGYAKSTSKYAKEWLTETLPNSTSKRHLPFKKELVEYIQSLGTEEEKEEKEEKNRIAEVKEIKEFLSSVLRGQEKESVLRMVGIGCQDTIEIPAGLKMRLKAAELLGKMQGAFRDKIDISLEPVQIVNDLTE